MHPILFTIPFLDWPVHTYGLLVATGFLVGMRWISYEAGRLGESRQKIMDLAFYIIIAAIVGSRVLYVVIDGWEPFLDNPLYVFQIWRGGLVFYGGVIGAMLVSVWYIRRHHVNGWRWADIFAPAIPLGQAIGRIGCIMAGCCYGRPVGHDAWWAFVFPSYEHAIAPVGIPLYPTQLVESIGNLLIMFVLMMSRRYKRFEGQVISLYLILYAVLRSGIEMFRGDVARGFWLGISTSQWISLVMVIVALMIMWRRYPRGRNV